MKALYLFTIFLFSISCFSQTKTEKTIFDDIPVGTTSKIYIKNTVAAIGHALIDDILEFSPTTKSETYEVAAPLLYTQEINLTDENYSGLEIENATIKIETEI